MSSSTGLWRRMQAQVNDLVAGMVERRRVVGIDGDGRLRVAPLDPSLSFEERVACVRGIVVDIGDDVACIRLGARLLAIGAIGAPGGGMPGSGGGGAGGEARVLVATSPPNARTIGALWFNPVAPAPECDDDDIIISDFEPSNPEPGTMWLDPD